MSELLVAVGHGWESALVTALGGVPGVHISRRCPDLADLLAAAAAGHGDVAVVSTDLRGVDRAALAGLAAQGMRVVGASQDGSEAAERELRQLGVTTFVHPGLEPEEIGPRLQGATRLEEPLRSLLPTDDDVAPLPVDDMESLDGEGGGVPALPGTDDGPGRVVAVWGPTGAPGRTTLAVNVAAELAAAGRSVVLVDLDTYGAAVGQAISLLDEAPGIAAAARASELGRLDLPALARLAPEASPGLRVISGIGSPARWPEIRGAAVEHVIDLARGLAQVVVLDLGFCIEDDEELSYDTAAPRRNETTLTALGQADDLLVVGSGDPVGLQRLVRAVQSLAAVPSPEPRPVVNRVRAGVVGPDPERRIAESLARFAGLDDIVFVPDDPAALDEAMLRGSTLVECAPQSAARRAIAALAASLVGAEHAAAPAPRRRRGLFRRGA